METPWFKPFLAGSLLCLGLSGCFDQSSSSTADSATPADQAAQTGDASAPDDRAQGQADDAAQAPAQAVADMREQGVPERQPAPPSAPPPGGMAGAHMATPVVGAGVRGDVGLFYDQLARQGSWVKHPDYSYVWIPAHMGPGWRPYQEGHWVWTDDYGWYWESEEPFAWAVYHYGRWDYDPDYGWFWVPGDTWAPAWVTWRVGQGAVGWAPIAPDRPGYATGAPQRFAPPILESWVFVDPRHFGEEDVGIYALPPSRIGATIDIANDMRVPRFENGRLYNAALGREDIQRFGGRYDSRQLVYVSNQGDMFEDVGGARVGIYRPTIASVQMRAAPPAVIDIGRADRIVVREYATPSVRVAVDVPSAALLDVLQPNEREGLLKTRLQNQAAADKEIEKLKSERAAAIKQKEQQAQSMQAELEKQRNQALLARQKDQQQIRALKRQLASQVKVDNSAQASQAMPAAPAPASADAAPATPAQGAAGGGMPPAGAAPVAPASPPAASAAAPGAVPATGAANNAPADSNAGKGRSKKAHQPGGPGAAEPASETPAATPTPEQDAEAPANAPAEPQGMKGKENAPKKPKGAAKAEPNGEAEATPNAGQGQPKAKGSRAAGPSANATPEATGALPEHAKGGGQPHARPAAPAGEAAATPSGTPAQAGGEGAAAKKAHKPANEAAAKTNGEPSQDAGNPNSGGGEKVSSGVPKAKKPKSKAEPSGQGTTPPAAAEGQAPAAGGAGADPE